MSNRTAAGAAAEPEHEDFVLSLHAQAQSILVQPAKAPPPPAPRPPPPAFDLESSNDFPSLSVDTKAAKDRPRMGKGKKRIRPTALGSAAAAPSPTDATFAAAVAEASDGTEAEGAAASDKLLARVCKAPLAQRSSSGRLLADRSSESPAENVETNGGLQSPAALLQFGSFPASPVEVEAPPPSGKKGKKAFQAREREEDVKKETAAHATCASSHEAEAGEPETNEQHCTAAAAAAAAAATTCRVIDAETSVSKEEERRRRPEIAHAAQRYADLVLSGRVVSTAGELRFLARMLAAPLAASKGEKMAKARSRHTANGAQAAVLSADSATKEKAATRAATALDEAAAVAAEVSAAGEKAATESSAAKAKAVAAEGESTATSAAATFDAAAAATTTPAVAAVPLAQAEPKQLLVLNVAGGTERREQLGKSSVARSFVLRDGADCRVFAAAALAHLAPLLETLGPRVLAGFAGSAALAEEDPGLAKELGAAANRLRAQSDCCDDDDDASAAASAFEFSDCDWRDGESRLHYETAEERRAYQNRQLCLDKLTEAVRDYEGRPRDLSGAEQSRRALRHRAREILSTVEAANSFWFAELFVSLLISAGLRPMREKESETAVVAPLVAPQRLQSLQRRIEEPIPTTTATSQTQKGRNQRRHITPAAATAGGLLTNATASSNSEDRARAATSSSSSSSAAATVAVTTVVGKRITPSAVPAGSTVVPGKGFENSYSSSRAGHSGRNGSVSGVSNGNGNARNGSRGSGGGGGGSGGSSKCSASAGPKESEEAALEALALPLFPGNQEFFYVFVVALNDARFARHLAVALSARAAVLLEAREEETTEKRVCRDGTVFRVAASDRWLVERIMKLKVLARLLGVLTFSPGWVPGPLANSSAARNARRRAALQADAAAPPPLPLPAELSRAAAAGRLALAVPYATEFLRMAGWDAVSKQRQSFGRAISALKRLRSAVIVVGGCGDFCTSCCTKQGEILISGDSLTSVVVKKEENETPFGKEPLLDGRTESCQQGHVRIGAAAAAFVRLEVEALCDDLGVAVNLLPLDEETADDVRTTCSSSGTKTPSESLGNGSSISSSGGGGNVRARDLETLYAGGLAAGNPAAAFAGGNGIDSEMVLSTGLVRCCCPYLEGIVAQLRQSGSSSSSGGSIGVGGSSSKRNKHGKSAASGGSGGGVAAAADALPPFANDRNLEADLPTEDVKARLRDNFFNAHPELRALVESVLTSVVQDSADFAANGASAVVKTNEAAAAVLKAYTTGDAAAAEALLKRSHAEIASLGRNNTTLWEMCVSFVGRSAAEAAAARSAAAVAALAPAATPVAVTRVAAALAAKYAQESAAKRAISLAEERMVCRVCMSAREAVSAAKRENVLVYIAAWEEQNEAKGSKNGRVVSAAAAAAGEETEVASAAEGIVQSEEAFGSAPEAVFAAIDIAPSLSLEELLAPTCAMLEKCSTSSNSSSSSKSSSSKGSSSKGSNTAFRHSLRACVAKASETLDLLVATTPNTAEPSAFRIVAVEGALKAGAAVLSAILACGCGDSACVVPTCPYTLLVGKAEEAAEALRLCKCVSQLWCATAELTTSLVERSAMANEISALLAPPAKYVARYLSLAALLLAAGGGKTTTPLIQKDFLLGVSSEGIGGEPEGTAAECGVAFADERSRSVHFGVYSGGREDKAALRDDENSASIGAAGAGFDEQFLSNLALAGMVSAMSLEDWMLRALERAHAEEAAGAEAAFNLAGKGEQNRLGTAGQSTSRALRSAAIAVAASYHRAAGRELPSPFPSTATGSSTSAAAEDASACFSPEVVEKGASAEDVRAAALSALPVAPSACYHPLHFSRLGCSLRAWSSEQGE